VVDEAVAHLVRGLHRGTLSRFNSLDLALPWFVATGVKMLNALFGVAYGLETPFFPHLAAPNVAPKNRSISNLYRTPS
jgi:hypothetical protein